MSNRRSNKQHLEYIFTPSGDQALASGNISTAGNAVNILNGQLGLKVHTHNGDLAGVDFGDFVTAGQTVADAESVQLVLGNAYSADTTQVRGWDIKKPFQAGPIWHKNKVRMVSARLCKVPTHSATVFTGFNAPEDLTLYNAYVEMRSIRKDRDYGRALDTFPLTYLTPDYTTLGTVNPLDDLLQNMLHRLNLSSKGINTSPNFYSKGNKPVIGFGVNVAGGAGQALGTITCGTSITVMTTTNGATTINSTFVADEAFVQTVADWIANTSLTAASTIEVIDLSTAGAAAKIDAVVIMGLDHELSESYDDIYSTKVRVDVEIGEGFAVEPLYTKVVASNAYDGYGDGRGWRIRYDERAHGLDYTMQLAGHSDEFIQIDRNIDETKSYNATIIESFDAAQMLTRDQEVQSRTIILMECTVTCNTAGAATPIAYANAQPATVASLNAIVSPWIASAQTVDNLDVVAGADEATAGVTATNYFV